ncbi:hypothetical protein DBA20_20355 [Pandoraea capi]|nr:hypothetical protein [Pandoraea sp. LA3]MDN4585330.1 hypothetical protein [Pandoraea capi]
MFGWQHRAIGPKLFAKADEGFARHRAQACRCGYLAVLVGLAPIRQCTHVVRPPEVTHVPMYHRSSWWSVFMKAGATSRRLSPSLASRN